MTRMTSLPGAAPRVSGLVIGRHSPYLRAGLAAGLLGVQADSLLR
jgi:hypothetical protein